MKPQIAMSEQEQPPRFSGITDSSLRMQIAQSELRIRLHLSRENWAAIQVDSGFAAEMDAELRRRHNERTFPARRRTA